MSATIPSLDLVVQNSFFLSISAIVVDFKKLIINISFVKKLIIEYFTKVN